MNYIVIQGITLAILLAVYKLTLSRTTLHGFNRRTLLMIMALSAVLPLIRVSLPEKQTDAVPAPLSEYLTAPVEYIMPEYIADAGPVESAISAPRHLACYCIGISLQTECETVSNRRIPDCRKHN